MARELPETPLTKSKGTVFGNATVQAVVLLIGVATFGGLFLLRNPQSNQRIALPAPVYPSPSVPADWRMALESQLDNPATAEPSALPLPTYTPTQTPFPTATSQLLSIDDIEGTPLATYTPLPTGFAPPTEVFRGSTPVPRPTGIAVADGNIRDTGQFQPPPEQIPLSLQPYDHFYLRRPLDADANGESLFFYPYGSGGEVFRIHHGIDIPNPIGERVLAAADGTVVFSGRNTTSAESIDVGTLEVYGAYGEMIVIQHDFSFQGQPVWTLYAHLSSRLVENGQQVKMGDVIGLVGNTGFVTGAHIHFEVRVGVNNYWNTRNPLLWIAPYLNHGVVAGRILDTNGNFVQNALIQLNYGGRRADSTTSYLRSPQPDGSERQPHSIPDNNWQENFVMSDVPVGEYQVVVVVEGRRYSQSINVRAGMVNFVEFQIDPPEGTPIPIDDSGGGE